MKYRIGDTYHCPQHNLTGKIYSITENDTEYQIWIRYTDVKAPEGENLKSNGMMHRIGMMTVAKVTVNDPMTLDWLEAISKT